MTGLLADGISPSDWLNSTTAVVVALIAVGSSFVLGRFDRKERRQTFKTEWERRADALTKQLAKSYEDRLCEKDDQIAARTKERDYWQSRWMGVPNDRGGGDRGK